MTDGQRSRGKAISGLGAARALHICINWRIRTDWRAVPLLRRVATTVAQAEGFRAGELSVTVVGRRAMASLHQRYRSTPTTTDVLAFDLGTDRRRGLLEGEIVVCADVARRRSAALAEARRELALYVTHGLLHLAGYDDHDPRDYRRMHAREDALLTECGVGPVFGRA